MPSELYKAIGDQWGLEGEVGFGEKLKDDKAQTLNRLAVADPSTASTPIPSAGERGQLPPEDEPRRLADEQGGPTHPLTKLNRDTRLRS
jgi:hypothetical protein